MRAVIVEGLGTTAAVESALAQGAHALYAEGDLRTAREWFGAAYRDAERAGDAEAMAAAVLGLGGLWVHEHRTAAGGEVLRARLRRALSSADPRSALALRLRVRLAGEQDYRVGAHEEIFAVLDEARLLADPVAHVEALSLAHHAILGPDHGVLRRALAEELIGESVRTGRRSDLLMGLLWQTVDLFLDAEPHAERRLGELRDALAQGGNLAIRFVVSAIEVMLAIRAGRFAEAEALALACAERGAAAGDVDATGWLGAQLFAIRWYQGRLAELLPMLTELVRSDTLSAIDNSYFAAVAVAAARAGDRRAAAGALARLGDPACLPRSSTWLVTMSGAVEAAHLLGDTEFAASAYHLLHPFAHLPIVASLGIACFGSVHYALGLAALTVGDLDTAADHLRTAVRRNLALGHWPAAALSRLRHAQALRLRARPGDGVTAHREHAAAVEAAAALGMVLPDDGRKPARTLVTCTRQGRRWRVELGSRFAIVSHSVGMAHLALLTANPDVEIPAVELAGGAEAVDPSAAQPVLDPTALSQYRHRLARLDAEIESAEPAHAARVRAEREWLVDELARATGLGGRTRHFADGAERARIAVGKAIRRALARVGEADPTIGAHLNGTVHTGVRCSYRP